MSIPAASDSRNSKLEVLVATMHQNDFSLVEKMRLTKDAVIANQCEQWRYEETTSKGRRIRMISTATRGVGINRNLALQESEADILLFADDDIEYYDGALQGVEDAFKQLPDADVIFFAIDMTKNGEVFDKRRHAVRRLHFWNCMKYGTARMAIRREAVIRHRLSFSTLFGGGCMYSSGEDSIFIRDCVRAGLKLYSHDCLLGACAKDSSTWFSGYNDKYIYDRGAFCACAFPVIKHVIKWYYGYKLVKKTKRGILDIIQRMNDGIRGYKSLMSFDDIKQNSERRGS